MAYQRLQQNISQMYLNREDADVVFVIDGKRIPSHKSILRTMSEYFVVMFGPTWHTESEIVFNRSALADTPRQYDHSVSAKSFKEFLKFAYDVPRKLTMDNVKGVIDLAKGPTQEEEGRAQQRADRILTECEDFLKKSIKESNIRQVYEWAELYDMQRLKTEIILHTESALKSKNFHKFPYDYLEMILMSNALPCEEKDIFDACIKWAERACRTNSLDPTNMEQLRAQLIDGDDLLYQIRFTAMTSRDAAICIRSYPKLFKKDELREIICMVGQHRNDFRPNKFNWTPRRCNLEWSNGKELNCSRFIAGDKGKEGEAVYTLKRCEATRFTCNRRMTLKGFKCELSGSERKSIHLQIREINSDNHSVELLRPSPTFTVHFEEKQTCVKHSSFLAHIRLNANDQFLLRPNYTYEISITFDNQLIDMKSLSSFKQKVRFDHDLVVRFDKKYRGIVASLSIRRFDDRKFLSKLVRDPKLWISIIATALIVCIGSALYVWPKPIFYIYNMIRVITPYVLYAVGALLFLCCCCIIGLNSDSNLD